MPLDAFGLIERVRELSPAAANALYNQLIPFLIPLARGLSVKVRQADDARTVLSMPLSRRTRNHVGSLYIGAQMTLADLTAGIALFRRYPPGPYGGLIRRVEADYRLKAKGLIRCVCETPPELIETLDRVHVATDGKAEAWVPLQLLDPEDRVVTDVRLQVALKKF
jgi:acyl-coenzyme A thioesterase PaaI-like protein